MLNAVSFLFPNILPIRRIARRFFQHFWYHRGHISHMRLDCLRRLIKGHRVFTVFVAPPSGQTVPLRMYFNLTFIHNYLRRSQLFAITLQSRILSLPSHIVHSFRGRVNHCRTFIWTDCVHPGSRSWKQWETSWLGRLLIFIFVVCSQVDLVCCLELFPLFLHTYRLSGDALNADGTLKDASEITWYNDKDDTTLIASGSNPPRMIHFHIHTIFLFLFLFQVQLLVDEHATLLAWPRL